MITFSHPSFAETSSKEWLYTNGIGGYASSTVSGANTRRYHGLLVASLNPPTDRQVLVSKILETVSLKNGTTVELSTNQYVRAIHPQGFQYLAAFQRSPLPKAIYVVKGKQLSKTIFMQHGTNTTIVEYENLSAATLELEFLPLFVSRNYHSLFKENSHFDYYHEILSEGAIKIHSHYGSAPLFMRFTKGTFTVQHDWFHSFQYDKEAYRGLDAQEDAHSIGRIILTLTPKERVHLVFSTDEAALLGQPQDWKQAELDRLDTLVPKQINDAFLRDLMVSSDQFLVRRKSKGNTVIAGYHWFTDWGRDTMIAMRGLTIALKKKELSASIIRTFLEHLDSGMIPNRFPDQGEIPEYNTIDATLWLFVVLLEYYEQFEDLELITEVFPSLQSIIEAHLKGMRYNIHVTADGLLFGGEDLAQLTWMDAKVGDFVVTPRHGCPVEINALWYNALEIYNLFHRKIAIGESPYQSLAQKVRHAFQQYFINEKGYLNDVIIPNQYIDDAIRPNQIYALSLPFTPLSREVAATVLQVVEEKLYTDLGLRSLSPAHTDFKPTYSGNPWQRDTAYHQGTVWAFLWGEYALAYLKQHHFSATACRVIKEKSRAFQNHFYQSDCLYAISEIFDGAKPEAGRGCVQQAWSVGMMLRVLLDQNFQL